MLSKEMNQLRNGFRTITEGHKKSLTSADRVLDVLVESDKWMEGVRVMCSGQAEGDTLSMEIVHPVYGVVDTFGANVNIDPTTFMQINNKSKYWAKLLTGLTVRLSYHTTQTTDVKLYVDFYFHKEK